MIINPYLNFSGNAEEAFNFYKSVFGGEFSMVVRFSDMGQADKLPEAEKAKMMHIALPIGSGNVLMATDALESMGHTLTVGNSFYISIHTDSKADADRIFNGLSAGGKIEVPMSEQDWGDYFGMFDDKFGIKWMVNFPGKKNQ